MQHSKKYAYSASAANMIFTEKSEQQFKELIKNFDALSCRESYLSNFIENETGISAPHVLDPVLLLNPDQYDSITGQRIFKDAYLLIYIPVQYDSSIRKCAIEYARKHNLKIVECSFYSWDRIHNKVIMDAGIEDFLSLIRNADTIFTSSFHAVCFSILFKKDFYSFERNTGKKTEDLCKSFGLHDRYFSSENFKELPPIRYDVITRALKEKRNFSLLWIKNNILN